LFEGKARTRALALFAFAVVALARTLSPAIGGYLTEWYSWRYIFFLNVPLILAAVTLLVVFLPDVRAASAASMRLDLVGLLLGVAWVVSLQVMLSRGERDDWFSDPSIVALAAVAAICLPLFVLWEIKLASKGGTTIIPLDVYRSRNFVLGSVYVVILGMMLYGQMYVIPQFLRGIQHHSAWGTGQLQTFNAAFFFVGLLAGAIFMARVGIRTSLGVGAAFFAAGMVAWTTRLTPQISDSAMLLPLALTGLGAGWQIGPVSTLINRDTPNARVGAGMELYLSQRQLGGSWGIALLAILIDRRRSFWSGRLGEGLTSYSLLAQDALRQTAEAFRASGLPSASADAGAVGVLHQRLVLQSVVNAFVDTFAYQAALGVFAVCLVLFFAANKRSGGLLRWAAFVAR